MLYADPRLNQQDPTQQNGEQEGFFESLVKAPLRGVAGGVAGVANLFGADIEDNFGLGNSEGFVPGLVQGFTQFLTGFVPIGGALGKIGALSTAGKTGAALVKTAAARGAVAGAASDFLMFDGNDPRLSNLIQSVPSLQNPITEFLAASPDDSESWGRLKNVIEGLGLGAITDSVMSVMGRMRARNDAIAKGDTARAKQLEDEAANDAKAGVVNDDLDRYEQELLDEEELAAAQPVESQVAQDAPGSPQDPQAPKDAQDSQSAAQGPQPPQDPPKVTPQSVRDRARWDPTKGEVILVDVSKSGSTEFVEGLHQWDAFVPQEGSSMQILQLKPGAELINGWSREAKDLVSNQQLPSSGSARKAAINKAAAAAGYDGVRWKRGNETSLTVVNRDIVEQEIQMVHGRNEIELEAKAQTLRQPEPTAASPLEAGLAKAGYSAEVRERALQGIEAARIAVRKIYGTPTNKASTETATRKLVRDEMLDRVHGFNFVMMDTGTAALTGRAVAEEMDDALSASGYDPVSQKQHIAESVDDIHKFLRMSPTDVAVQMQADGAALSEIRRRATAATYVAHKIARELHGIADEMIKRRDGKPATAMHAPDGRELSIEELALIYDEAHMNFTKLVGAVGHVGSEFGRGLKSRDIRISQMTKNQAIAMLERRGGLEATLKRAEQFLQDQKMGGVEHAMRMGKNRTRAARLTGIALDWYYFSLLSGLRTLTTNTIGTGLTQIWEPFERIMGSVMRKFGGTPEEIAAANRQIRVEQRALAAKGEMWAQTMRLFLNGESLRDTPMGRVASRAWEGGKRLIGGSSTTFDSNTRGISVENVNAVTGANIADDSKLGGVISWVGRMTQLPGRIMGTTDEMLKFVEARATVGAELAEQAYEMGLRGSAIDDFVEQNLQDFIRDGELISRELFQREAEQTYTRELFPDPNSRAAHIQNYVLNQMKDQRVDLQTGLETGTSVTGRMQLAERAKLQAERTTFTQKLNPDRGALSALGLAMQKFTAQHPLTKFFVPFVQTPMNLLLYASERMPIPVINKEFSGFVTYMANRITKLGKIDAARNKFVQALAKGGPEAADAWGRATTAMGALSFLGVAASTGVITGRGPDDPEHRALMVQAGWQPYSIKVGDVYMSYQRLDPFASVMGIMADVIDIGRYSSDEETVADVGWHTLMALLTNLESKSYLAGLSDMAGLVHDPVRYVQKVGNRIVGSAIPNVIASARSMTDEYTTEVRGMLDTLLNRVPFLGNATVAPGRNLLGEKVTKKQLDGAFQLADGFAQFTSPLSFNRSSSDVVTTELANLGYPFNAQKPQKWGVDLRDYTNDKGQTAYDRWLELTGEVSVGGRKLRPAMERLIKSNEYQRLDYRAIDKADLDSPRVSKVQGLLEKYRRAALMEMLGEFPVLRDHTRARRIASESMRTGDTVESIRARLFPMEAR